MTINYKIASSALIAGLMVFGPATAQQGSQGLEHPNAADVRAAQIEATNARKIKALGALPGLKNTANTLREIQEKALKMKEDEAIADPTLPKSSNAPENLDALPNAAQHPGGASTPAGPEAAAAPPASSSSFPWRLKGTIVGDNDPVAMFDTGAMFPVVVKPGDQLDKDTIVVAVENGEVTLKSQSKLQTISPW